MKHILPDKKIDFLSPLSALHGKSISQGLIIDEYSLVVLMDTAQRLYIYSTLLNRTISEFELKNHSHNQKIVINRLSFSSFGSTPSVLVAFSSHGQTGGVILINLNDLTSVTTIYSSTEIFSLFVLVKERRKAGMSQLTCYSDFLLLGAANEKVIALDLNGIFDNESWTLNIFARKLTNLTAFNCSEANKRAGNLSAYWINKVHSVGWDLVTHLNYLFSPKLLLVGLSSGRVRLFPLFGAYDARRNLQLDVGQGLPILDSSPFSNVCGGNSCKLNLWVKFGDEIDNGVRLVQVDQSNLSNSAVILSVDNSLLEGSITSLQISTCTNYTNGGKYDSTDISNITAITATVVKAGKVWDKVLVFDCEGIGEDCREREIMEKRCRCVDCGFRGKGEHEQCRILDSAASFPISYSQSRFRANFVLKTLRPEGFRSLMVLDETQFSRHPARHPPTAQPCEVRARIEGSLSILTNMGNRIAAKCQTRHRQDLNRFRRSLPTLRRELAGRDDALGDVFDSLGKILHLAQVVCEEEFVFGLLGGSTLDDVVGLLEGRIRARRESLGMTPLVELVADCPGYGPVDVVRLVSLPNSEFDIFGAILLIYSFVDLLDCFELSDLISSDLDNLFALLDRIGRTISKHSVVYTSLLIWLIDNRPLVLSSAKVILHQLLGCHFESKDRWVYGVVLERMVKLGHYSLARDYLSAVDVLEDCVPDLRLFLYIKLGLWRTAARMVMCSVESRPELLHGSLMLAKSDDFALYLSQFGCDIGVFDVDCGKSVYFDKFVSAYLEKRFCFSHVGTAGNGNLKNILIKKMGSVVPYEKNSFYSLWESFSARRVMTDSDAHDYFDLIIRNELDGLGSLWQQRDQIRACMNSLWDVLSSFKTEKQSDRYVHFVCEPIVHEITNVLIESTDVSGEGCHDVREDSAANISWDSEMNSTPLSESPVSITSDLSGDLSTDDVSIAQVTPSDAQNIPFASAIPKNQNCDILRDFSSSPICGNGSIVIQNGAAFRPLSTSFSRATTLPSSTFVEEPAPMGNVSSSTQRFAFAPCVFPSIMAPPSPHVVFPYSFDSYKYSFTKPDCVPRGTCSVSSVSDNFVFTRPKVVTTVQSVFACPSLISREFTKTPEYSFCPPCVLPHPPTVHVNEVCDIYTFSRPDSVGKVRRNIFTGEQRRESETDGDVSGELLRTAAIGEVFPSQRFSVQNVKECDQTLQDAFMSVDSNEYATPGRNPHLCLSNMETGSVCGNLTTQHVSTGKESQGEPGSSHANVMESELIISESQSDKEAEVISDLSTRNVSMEEIPQGDPDSCQINVVDPELIVSESQSDKEEEITSDEIIAEGNLPESHEESPNEDHIQNPDDIPQIVPIGGSSDLVEVIIPTENIDTAEKDIICKNEQGESPNNEGDDKIITDKSVLESNEDTTKSITNVSEDEGQNQQSTETGEMNNVSVGKETAEENKQLMEIVEHIDTSPYKLLRDTEKYKNKKFGVLAVKRLGKLPKASKQPRKKVTKVKETTPDPSEIAEKMKGPFRRNKSGKARELKSEEQELTNPSPEVIVATEESRKHPARRERGTEEEQHIIEPNAGIEESGGKSRKGGNEGIPSRESAEKVRKAASSRKTTVEEGEQQEVPDSVESERSRRRKARSIMRRRTDITRPLGEEKTRSSPGKDQTENNTSPTTNKTAKNPSTIRKPKKVKESSPRGIDPQDQENTESERSRRRKARSIMRTNVLPPVVPGEAEVSDKELISFFRMKGLNIGPINNSTRVMYLKKYEAMKNIETKEVEGEVGQETRKKSPVKKGKRKMASQTPQNKLTLRSGREVQRH